MSTAQVGGYRVEAAPGLDGAAAARDLLALLPSLRPEQGKEALERALAGRGRLLRWRRHRAALLLEAGPLAPAHLKIYRPKDVLETALGVVTPARGLTSWRIGRALLEAKLPTPEPRLLLLAKPLRVHRETVLVTAPIENPVHLTDELKARLASRVPLRPLLDAVARLAARFHAAGFLHGDFTASNLVLDAKGALWVIDLDRAKDLRSMPRAMRIRAQLLDVRMLLLTTWGEVTRREWLRLLAIYLRERKLGRARGKRFARAVLSARRGRVRVGAKTGTIGGRVPWPD